MNLSDQQKYEQLLRLYREKRLTEAERQELYESVQQDQNEADWKAIIAKAADETEPLVAYKASEWEPLLQEIIATKQEKPTEQQIPVKRVRPQRWVRYAAAAVIVLSIGGAYLWKTAQKKEELTTNPYSVKTDVPAPAVARAVLTLADGTTIALDSASAGTITRQGKVVVSKKETGEIVYTGANETAMYNTLTNPRGSKVINTILSDGSKVWLNAESSLRYPITFVGRERKVEITGEAYFEVTHDARKKFIVEAGGITTEVLGTHFNVNTYDDEQTKRVTLLEGKVKVASPNSSLTLNPGEQAQINESDLTKTTNVNLEQVMAWKNGLFRFNSTDIKTLMKQVARWYDIEVIYKGDITADRFTGGIPRTATLKELLAILEDSRVHFTLEGKTLTVLP